MSEPDSGPAAQVSEPDRQPHDAWAGPSGLRVERLAAPAGAATVAMEPSPDGEPMWLTPGHWRDLCDAAAQLGPGWADPPETGTPEGPAAAEQAQARPPILPAPPEITPEGPE